MKNQKKEHGLARTNELLHKASKTAGQGLAGKPKKKKKSKTRNQPGVRLTRPLQGPQMGKPMRAAREAGGLVGSPYHDYLLTLSRPFDVANVFCPVSYNPAPSFIASRARTTSTDLSMTVALGTTTQFCLMPGHGPQIQGASAAQTTATGQLAGMDATAYHHLPAMFNATGYSLGPVSTVLAQGTFAASAGSKLTGVGPGLSFHQTQAQLGTTGLLWDVPLPYTAAEAEGHTRWQLVSMGIRVRNITNDLYRGGTVVTVMPATSTAWVNNDPQSKFERFPTFHDWGRCEGMEVAWIPRATDMSYWHTSGAQTSSTYASNNTGAGLIVWFNAPADYAQTYSYEIVYNWQLSGEYLTSVGGAAPHHPSLKGPVEQTISGLMNSSPSANVAKEVGVAALKATGLTQEGIVGKLQSFAVEAGKRAVAGFA